MLLRSLLAFGGGDTNKYSYDFNGSSYLTTPSSASVKPGTGNFTVEFFIYLRSTPSADTAVFDTRGGGGNTWAIQINSSNQLKFLRGAGSSTSGTAISLDTWTFITVSRVSGTLRFFYGTSEVVTTTSYSGTDLGPTNGALTIGANQADSNKINALISNLRYRIGSGVTSVTVPTAPLEAVAPTSLLTCRSSEILDLSGNAFTLTNNGGVTVSTSNPFGA